MKLKRAEVIKIFAENLRAERARKNYSQEYLAEIAGISVEYLSRMENEYFSPSVVIIANLAIALGVSIDKLVPLDKYIK